jgi:hypothetical protein
VLLQQRFLGFFTRVSARVSVQEITGGIKTYWWSWVVRVRGQIIGVNNEEGSEPPETPVQLNCELALPHRARATGLAATPRLFALVGMGEEGKRRGRVGRAVDDDRYRRVMVVVAVVVVAH